MIVNATERQEKHKTSIGNSTFSAFFAHCERVAVIYGDAQVPCSGPSVPARYPAQPGVSSICEAKHGAATRSCFLLLLLFTVYIVNIMMIMIRYLVVFLSSSMPLPCH